MDHTLKWGLPPSKISYLKFFPFLVLVYFACSSSGSPQVNKTVNDIAILSCDYNISTLELAKTRIYWQKQNDMVLSVVNGNVKVWEKYENRTIPVFRNNHSIAILGLRLSDNGTYTCIIQKLNRGLYKVEHRVNVKLLVKAHFHVPSITDLGNPSPKIKRIQCETSGGFPEPRLSWVENGGELTAANTTVSQDPKTELYTISSELDFNVTDNHSFMCLVKYGNLQVSQNFTWRKINPDPDHPSLPWLSILCALLAVFILVIAVRGCWACRQNASRKGGRRNAENMEMENIDPI